MWRDELMSQFVNHSSVLRIDMDYCKYGCMYKKPTSFFSNMSRLLALARKCDHKSHSIVLEGRVRLRDHGKMIWVWKTSRASPYPVALCRHVATLLAEVSPRGAFRQRCELPVSAEAFAEVTECFASGCSKSERGRLQLANACGEWPPPQAPIAPLPAREPRPWPAHAETWGRH